MICPKCNSNVNEGMSFCMNCGANLTVTPQVSPVQEIPEEQPVQVIPEQPVNNVQPVQEIPTQSAPVQEVSAPVVENVQPVQPVQEVPVQPQPVQAPVNNASVAGAALNYLMYLLMSLIKPVKNFKNEETKLEKAGTAFILAAIVSGIMTLVSTIETALAFVRVSSFSFTSGYSTSWDWSNLKEVKWVQTIVGGFLTSACLILATTVVFYLASLVIKKQLKFTKALSISATALLPIVICVMVLAPLFALLWMPLSLVFSVAGVFYSFFILYELMNNEIGLEGDKKIYFNLACFVILLIGLYFVSMKLIENSISGVGSDLLGMFN